MARREKVTDINVYRNQRRKSKNVRWVSIPVFLVACMFAGYFFSLSGFFGISNIVIVGNTTVPDENIIALSGLEKGMNIFAADKNVLAKMIPIEPRIKSATIERKLPGTIKITVVEREAVAIFSTGLAIAEIDIEGRIIDRYTTVTSQGLPLISGLDLEGQGCIPGNYIEGIQMETVLAILESLPENAEDIGEINVTNPQFIKLYTLTGIEIRLGDNSNFQEKHLVYSTILDEQERKAERKIKYIDVSIVSKPTINYYD